MLEEAERISRAGRTVPLDPPPELGGGADEHAPNWVDWHDNRAPQARQQLINAYLPYARMLAAKTFATRTHDEVAFADYYQLACVGLIEAVDRYDPHRGVRFKAYAARRIVGAILNGLEQQTEKTRQISVRKQMHQERLAHIKAVAQRQAAARPPENHDAAEDMDEADAVPPPAPTERTPEELFRYLSEVGIGVALGILLEDTGMIDHDAFATQNNAASPEVSYFRHEALRTLRAHLQSALARLAPAQQLVIQLHYLQSMSFIEIAERLDLSRGRISQLHRQALTHLRKLMRPPPTFDLSA